MTWRLATAISTLRDDLGREFPHRSKASDGTIGDPRHQAEGSSSDHNPWVIDNGVGVVRALDITSDPVIDPASVAERIRLMGLNGDLRVNGGGYVIYNRRIASANGNWAWRTYTGSDPHVSHIHVSVSRSKAGYDSADHWHVTKDNTVTQPPAPANDTENVSDAEANLLTQAVEQHVSMEARNILVGVGLLLGKTESEIIDAINKTATQAAAAKAG